MLRELELSNFAIVDELKLEFGPGLNVLTGETGAGKSILMDALTLLSGARAEASWIRKGASSALIQGIFDGERPPNIDSAARRLSAGGRSNARLNGELITVTELSERMSDLVVIHGQHASQTLMSTGEQRKLLDRLLPSKARDALSLYRKRYAEYMSVTKDIEQLREQVRERARRVDMLSFQLDEIDAAKLKPDEVSELENSLQQLRHAERIVSAASQALENLSEGELNAVDLASQAAKDLESAGRYSAELSNLSTELSDALLSVKAVADELSSFLGGFEADPAALEEAEARLASIEALKRKYGDSVEAVLTYRDQAKLELNALENAEADMGRLESQQASLLNELETLAASLDQARKKAATALSKQVTQELKPLAMNKAQFLVKASPADALGPFGKTNVHFLFSANLGEDPALLSSVASGGELSRLMLALNVVTGSDLPVLAFDEVDAGIGGAVARAVGALLKRLAQDHQVLVVTHLPQVAAFADRQYYVEKRETEGRTVTRVMGLEPAERELELARMLSGTTSDAALANARELLSEAQGG